MGSKLEVMNQKWMKGGNEATIRSGVTQFAEGERKNLTPASGSPNGECVIPFACAHSITAFHSCLLPNIPYFPVFRKPGLKEFSKFFLSLSCIIIIDCYNRQIRERLFFSLLIIYIVIRYNNQYDINRKILITKNRVQIHRIRFWIYTPNLQALGFCRLFYI